MGMYLLMAVVLLSIKQDIIQYVIASFSKHLECRWMSLSTDYHQREFHALLKIIWGRFDGILGGFLFPRE